jgi:hypothetical protein
LRACVFFRSLFFVVCDALLSMDRSIASRGKFAKCEHFLGEEEKENLFIGFKEKRDIKR